MVPQVHGGGHRDDREADDMRAVIESRIRRALKYGDEIDRPLRRAAR